MYNHLIDIANESIHDTELLIEEKSTKEFTIYLKRLIRRINKSKPFDILKIPNYELFLIAIFASNSVNKSLFKNYQEELEELADSINKWEFNTHGKDLLELYDHTTDDGNLTDYQYLNNFNNLNISLIAMNYNLKVVYVAMHSFLKLKHELMEAKNAFSHNEHLIMIPRENRHLFNAERQANLRKIYEKTYIKVFLEAIEDQLDKENKEYEEECSILRLRIKYTKEVIKNINKLADMKKMPDNWHCYLDPRLLEELYNIMQQNTIKEHKELLTEKASISSIKDKSILTTFLYDKGYNPYSLNEDILTKLEQIPNIILFINTLLDSDISIEDIFTNYINTLINLTEDKINTIKDLLSKKILSPETLKNRISDIYGSKYQYILTNIDILTSIIDYTSIFYDDSILFKNPQEIKDILSVLSYYNLSKSNFIFLLCHYEYLNIYDLLIENEIPVSLFISICKTDNPKNTIKRILLYKMISEQYETNNHHLRREMTSEEKFICSDQDLDESVSNVVPFVTEEIPNTGAISAKTVESSIVKELDIKYRLDSLYIIGNAIISRPKFLRNIEHLNQESHSIIPALISGSIIDESTYYSLYEEINNSLYRKTLRK